MPGKGEGIEVKDADGAWQGLVSILEVSLAKSYASEESACKNRHGKIAPGYWAWGNGGLDGSSSFGRYSPGCGAGGWCAVRRCGSQIWRWGSRWGWLGGGGVSNRGFRSLGS